MAMAHGSNLDLGPLRWEKRLEGVTYSRSRAFPHIPTRVPALSIALCQPMALGRNSSSRQSSERLPRALSASIRAPRTEQMSFPPRFRTNHQQVQELLSIVSLLDMWKSWRFLLSFIWFLPAGVEYTQLASMGDGSDEMMRSNGRSNCDGKNPRVCRAVNLECHH